MFADVVSLFTSVILANSDINQAYDDQQRNTHNAHFPCITQALQLSITDWAFNVSHFIG